MQIDCKRVGCDGVIELPGTSHSVGAQPFHTEVTCPTCSTRWRAFFGDDGHVRQVVEVTDANDD